MSDTTKPPSDTQKSQEWPQLKKPKVTLIRRGPIAQSTRSSGHTSQNAEDAAIGWLARLRADDVTDSERADFAQWLWDKDQNKRAFDELTNLWGDLGVCKQLPTPHTRRAWLPLAQAASVFLVLAFALFLQFGQSSFSSDPGEQLTSTLSDGSKLTLNTNSNVEVAYTSGSRNLHLISGEIYVDVAHNPERPFAVRSKQGLVTAVGTGFSVRQMAYTTVVLVEKGLVAVNNQTNQLTLSAGEMAHITADTIVVSEQNVGSAHAWRHGRLVYDSVPLITLIDDLNRYLPKKMTISDSKLGEIVVSATLELQDQASMLEALSEILDLDWYILSDNLIIIQTHT